MNGWVGIARLGGVGDNLVASSVMRPLKKLGYMTEMITSETASSVLRNNPHIDKLSVRRDGELPGGHEWFAARASEYDLFVNLSHSMETRHAVRKTDAAFYWPREYRRKICGGSYLETAHDIVGVPHDFGPLFFPTEPEMEDLDRARRKTGGRYLAWVVGGTRVDKYYPYSPHAICRIVKEIGVPVVMIAGGQDQMERARKIEDEIRRTNSTIDGLYLAGTVEDSGALSTTGRAACLKAWGADVVVTPDTGVGWAVAMEAMPKIVMVSHASVENITKHWVNTETMHADQNRVPCWPCHSLHDDITTCVASKDGPFAACMADVPVQTLVDAVERAWNRNNVIPMREAAE